MKSQGEVPVLRSDPARWVIFAALLASIVLRFGPGPVSSLRHWEWVGYVKEPLEGLGEGLLVATVVTGLLHIAEFKSFFKRFAGSVMLDKAFLKDLLPEVLQALRTRTSQALVEEQVRNPEYEWEDLHAEAEKLLFNCFPSAKDPKDGIYRREYVENVTVQYMPISEVLAEIGEDSQGLSEADKATRMVRIERITYFNLIAPRVDNPRKTTVPYLVKLDPCPLIPVKKHVQLGQGVTREALSAVDLKVETNGGIISARADPQVRLSEGVGVVHRRAVEYQLGSMAPFLLYTMPMVTHIARLHLVVQGAREETKVEGVLVGGVGGKFDSAPLRNGVEMSFTGWLLRSHGFFAWWGDTGKRDERRPKAQATESAKMASLRRLTDPL